MQFTVIRTTTETFAVEGADAKTAKEEFDKNGGNQISHGENVQVQPRPSVQGAGQVVQRPQGSVVTSRPTVHVETKPAEGK